MQDIFVGALMGMTVSMLMLVLIPGSNYNVVHDAMNECEKSLPRDQTCKIIAVPVVKGLK